MSSLRRGHANLLCIVPILKDATEVASVGFALPLLFVAIAALLRLWFRPFLPLPLPLPVPFLTASRSFGSSLVGLSGLLLAGLAVLSVVPIAGRISAGRLLNRSRLIVV